MIKATVSEPGVVNFEHALPITEGQRDAIKANLPNVKNMLKDMGVAHSLSITEDGAITSTMGWLTTKEFNPEQACNMLKEKHDAFLRQVDKWITPPENSEFPRAVDECEALIKKFEENGRKVAILVVGSEDEPDCMCGNVHPIIVAEYALKTFLNYGNESKE